MSSESAKISAFGPHGTKGNYPVIDSRKVAEQRETLDRFEVWELIDLMDKRGEMNEKYKKQRLNMPDFVQKVAEIQKGDKTRGRRIPANAAKVVHREMRSVLVIALENRRKLPKKYYEMAETPAKREMFLKHCIIISDLDGKSGSKMLKIGPELAAVFTLAEEPYVPRGLGQKYGKDIVMVPYDHSNPSHNKLLLEGATSVKAGGYMDMKEEEGDGNGQPKER